MAYHFGIALKQIEQRDPETGLSGYQRIKAAAMATISDLYPMLQLVAPPVESYGYSVQKRGFSFESTMAPPIAQSAPYPEGNFIKPADSSHETAKFGLQTTFEEGALKRMQTAMLYARANSNMSEGQTIVNRAISNFVAKGLIEPNFKVWEYLVTQAYFTGALNWVFGGVRVQADYKLLSENLLAQRTGTAAYGGSASKFWDDVYELRQRLPGRPRYYLANDRTARQIVYNSANNINLVTEEYKRGYTRYVIRRHDGKSKQALSTDARDGMTIIGLMTKGNIIDPSAPEGVRAMEFAPEGRLVAISEDVDALMDFDSDVDTATGYTHVAPTVEAGNDERADPRGIYTKMAVLPLQAHTVVGVGVSNVVPVLPKSNFIAIAQTE